MRRTSADAKSALIAHLVDYRRNRERWTRRMAAEMAGRLVVNLLRARTNEYCAALARMNPPDPWACAVLWNERRSRSAA